MIEHFEDLWVEAEKVLEKETFSASIEDLIKELTLKAELYKTLSDKIKIFPKEDQQKLKEDAFGKLLLTITQISMKDNIDVFKALTKAKDKI